MGTAVIEIKDVIPVELAGAVSTRFKESFHVCIGKSLRNKKGAEPKLRPQKLC